MLTNQVDHDMGMLLETPGIGGSMSSSIDGPDRIPKQLMAFEKLLRHAISRFSKENLYDMLLTLNSEIDTPRSRGQGDQRLTTAAPNRKIQSMRHVRQLMKTIEEAAIRGKASDHELRSLKNFETFDRDVRYLRDLKAYFDSNILKSLREEYYEPETQTAIPDQKGTSAGKKSKQARDHARLPLVVTELSDLCLKWGELLSDGDLDISIFDADSHHELLQFENYHQFEPILRMVPDVFVKSYKAIDLGREWLALAVRIYGDRLPLRKEKPQQPPLPSTPSQKESKPQSVRSVRSRVGTAEVDERVNEVKEHINTINKHITEKQEKIVSLSQDEKKLAKREKRSEELTNAFEKVDNRMQRAKRDYQRAVADLDRMSDQIKFLPNNSPKYSDLIERCKKLEYDIETKQNSLQMLEFEKSVVQEDYLLELELRPTFIHFVGDVQSKIETLKNEVKEKQLEKKELEKQIVILRTSKSNSINKSMKRYLNGELAYDLEAVTQRMEEMAQEQDDARSVRSAVSGTTYSDSDVDLTEYLVDDGRQQSESDLQFVYDADGEKAGITKPNMRKDIIGKPRVPESVLAQTQNRQKQQAKVA